MLLRWQKMLIRCFVIATFFFKICYSETISCKPLYKYRSDGNGKKFGLIQIPVSDIGQIAKLEVELAMSVKLIRRFSGSLEFDTNQGDARDRIQNGKPLLYKFDLPSDAPEPEITKIIYNKKELCKNSQSSSSPAIISLTSSYDPKLLQSSPSATPSPPLLPEGSFGGIDLSGVISNSGLDGNVYNFVKNIQQSAISSTTPPVNVPMYNDDSCGLTSNTFFVRHFSHGGQEIRHGEWPWIAAMFRTVYREKSKFICGGTIINSRAVLTAAHCVVYRQVKLTIDQLSVYLGKFDLEANETTTKAPPLRSIEVHADYKSHESDADIAIIIFFSHVQFTDYIRPICIWPRGSDFRVSKGYVVGWGVDETQMITRTPRKVTSQIVSERTCVRSNGVYWQLTSERTFCAGNLDNTGPCEGDSGNGLTIKVNDRWMLRGIVSLGLTNTTTFSCEPNEYVVYTDVSKFTNWLQDILSKS